MDRSAITESDPTGVELAAIQAAVRGGSTDAEAFASFLGSKRVLADQLLVPGRHSPALSLLVLLTLVSRLRRAIAIRAQITWALTIVKNLREVAKPAPDLTSSELGAVGAFLRGERPDVPTLAVFLGESPFVAEGLLRTRRAMNDTVIARLALRLHGMQVEPEVLHEAIQRLLEREAQLLRRSGRH